MLKPDRFSCSQKIRLKWDPPVHSSPRREDRRSSGRPMSRSASGSGSRSCSRISTNRDRVRCYKCMEYDHFASDCPNSVTDKDSDQDDSSHSVLQMLTHDNPVGSELHEPIDYLNL